MDYSEIPDEMAATAQVWQAGSEPTLCVVETEPKDCQYGLVSGAKITAKQLKEMREREEIENTRVTSDIRGKVHAAINSFYCLDKDRTDMYAEELWKEFRSNYCNGKFDNFLYDVSRKREGVIEKFKAERKTLEIIKHLWEAIGNLESPSSEWLDIQMTIEEDPDIKNIVAGLRKCGYIRRYGGVFELTKQGKGALKQHYKTRAEQCEK